MSLPADIHDVIPEHVEARAVLSPFDVDVISARRLKQ